MFPKSLQVSKEKVLVFLIVSIFVSLILISGTLSGNPRRILLNLKNAATTAFISGSGDFNPETVQLYNRSKHLTRICPAFKEMETAPNLSDFYRNIVKSDNDKIAYCGIAKVGSSFWKRAFKVLNAGNKSQQHLFDMSSMSAHRSIPNSMRMSKPTAPEVLSQYTIFMFTRDPFARLFSGYVDKMILPNNIFLQLSQDVKRLLGPEKQKDCQPFVTFSDMCSYVAHCILHKERLNPHFSPIYSHCLPCSVNYTMVGKMETFMTDTKNILREAGIDLNRVMGTVDDLETTNERGIIDDLTKRTYEFMTRKYLGCSTQPEVLQRLWRVFQIRGFISKTIDFPESFMKVKEKDIPKEDFLERVFTAYNNSGDRSLRLQQRDESMQEAYASVDPKILQKLGLAFAKDCALFDYSCNVSERFLKHGPPKGKQFFF